MPVDRAAASKTCPDCGCRWRDSTDTCPECGASATVKKARAKKTKRSSPPLEFVPGRVVGSALAMLGAGAMGWQFLSNAITGVTHQGEVVTAQGRAYWTFAALVCLAVIGLVGTYLVRVFRR